METEKGNPKRKTAWNYSKADWDEFRTMSTGKHTTLDLEADLQTLNTEYTNAIISAATRNVPQGNRAKYTAFWNGDLEEAVNLRKKAWKVKRNNSIPENKREYNRLSAKVKLLSRTSKRNSERKQQGSWTYGKTVERHGLSLESCLVKTSAQTQHL